jgi:Fe-S-cluster containining protein
VRILNVMEAPAGRTRIPDEGMPSFSTTPCEHCEARCCSMQTTLSTVEVIRVARHTGRAPLELVEIRPYSRAVPTHLAWPFKLDGPVSRAVFSLRRTSGRCGLVTEERCGVYEARPAICRIFPFHVEDERGRVGVGNTLNCPVQWLQTAELREGLARDVERYREDRARDLESVRFWNRGRRARSVEGLVGWLMEHVAEQL